MEIAVKYDLILKINCLQHPCIIMRRFLSEVMGRLGKNRRTTAQLSPSSLRKLTRWVSFTCFPSPVSGRHANSFIILFFASGKKHVNANFSDWRLMDGALEIILIMIYLSDSGGWSNKHGAKSKTNFTKAVRENESCKISDKFPTSC